MFFVQWIIFLKTLFIFQQTIPCYQTKFTPQKKQSKQSKTLSDNIKKFLARKEEEEKQKVLEEKRKKEVSLLKICMIKDCHVSLCMSDLFCSIFVYFSSAIM